MPNAVPKRPSSVHTFNSVCVLFQITSGINSRFAPPVSDVELEQRRQASVPQNTVKRNNWSMRALDTWIKVRNNNNDIYDKMLRPLHCMSKMEIGHWMSKFVVEVRKQDPPGAENPPKTLLSMVMGIQAHLNFHHNLNLDLLSGVEFNRFRQVLDGEMKRLSVKGLGSVKRSEPILPDEEDKMWKKGQLGDRNPRVLLNTLIFLNGRNFALRSGQEHRNLRYRPAQIKETQGEKRHKERSKRDQEETQEVQNSEV